MSERPVGSAPRPRTTTGSTEVDAAPEAAFRVLADPRHLPQWAPGFADAVARDDDTGWTVTKNAARFALTVARVPIAGTVDYLREVAPGRTLGAYLRVTPRPGGGTVVVMTLPIAPATDPAIAATVLRQELNALAALLSPKRS